MLAAAKLPSSPIVEHVALRAAAQGGRFTGIRG
jgi:hypothetical protein